MTIVLDTIKNAVKIILRRTGFEIRLIPHERQPPKLFDNPLEVIHKINSHQPAALNCRLSECVAFNGLGFSEHAWHPFVQTAKEYIATGVRDYEKSCVKKYYDLWQPSNAREALIGASLGPAVLDKQPSYIKHLPWSHRSIEERAAYMHRVIEIENSAFGNAPLSVADGYGLHGPVSKQKGKLEYERIIDLVDSIRNWGYDRWRGDITVEALKRDGQFRYIITHGNHRAAVLTALEHKFIPVEPIVLIEDIHVNHWPGVYQKIWSEEEALTYFNHLFDFNSFLWAKEHNLC